MGLTIGNYIGIGKSSGKSWSSYWLTPNKSDQLFCLPGITFESGGNTYLRDVSGKNRHFLITDLDWSDDSRVSDLLPFKTIATISAPVGDATLIAADVDNFLYDAGGNPNALRPQHFFQNIDYKNKLFCRHTTQVLNADNTEKIYSGIKDITLYANAKTGTDLTTCNTYFSVPAKVTSNVIWVGMDGNDSAPGDGSEAHPYRTVTKAMTMITNNSTKTIYIKTGDYYSATYYFKDLTYTATNVTFYGIGRTLLGAADNTYILYWKESGLCHIYGLNFYGNNSMPIYASYSTRPDNVDRCIFNTPLGISHITSPAFTRNLLIGNGVGGFILDWKADTLGSATENMFYNAVFTATNRSLVATKTTFNYNKVYWNKASAAMLTLNGTCFDVMYNVVNQVNGNYFFYNGYYDATKGNAVFSYNTVTIDVGHIFGDNVANRYTSVTVNNNTINHTSLTGFSCLAYSMKYVDTLTMNYNVVTSVSKNGFSLVEMVPAAGQSVAITIKYNYVNSKSAIMGAIINFSEATIANVYDGAEIMYNYLKGGIVENYLETLNVHGILARSGKNMKIAYNWIEGCAIGIVYKNEGVANTSGGIYGNILINNRVDVYLRGCNEARIYNNVFYKDSTIANTNSYFVTADFQVANNTNCFFENNIFVRLNSVVNVALFNIQAASLAAGTKIKRNIVYCPDYTAGHWLYDGASYYSLADSVTAGYAENIDETNPQITASRPYPVPAIEGATDLGADFDDGLDVSSMWTQDVVLKQQGASWQYGAFVQ